MRFWDLPTDGLLLYKVSAKKPANDMVCALRMYGYLKKPYQTNSKDYIYKIMIHQTKKQGVFVYLYTSRNAIGSSFDHHYIELADALEDWEEEIDAQGWVKIEDPLPHCQHDCILPVRTKGKMANDCSE